MVYDILKLMNINNINNIIQYGSFEDDSVYDVWKVITNDNIYVLKKAKNYEIEIYTKLLSELEYGVPKLYNSVRYNDEDYILIEYVEGNVLNICYRDSLIKAVDALIYVQDYYWNDNNNNNVGYTYDKSLNGRINRSNYLNDKELEDEYKIYLDLYSKLPKTLCHDDLLPFNIISGNEAKIIDWEYAGMLPYLTSIARLLAHAGQCDEFFYMKEEDKEFIIKYYYDNLLKNKNIDYNDYIYSLSYFILYEYCEWIMLGNKYENSNLERYNMYKSKAKKLIASIKYK